MSVMQRQNPLKTLLLGGLLPVIIYTFVEEYFGILWGLVAGMVIGIAEIIVEKVRTGRVDAITWGGTGILLVLGGVSLVTQEGIWFKLQPALLELVMGGLLLVTWTVKKPFLVMMAKKQKMLERLPPAVAESFERRMSGLTFRLGLFFLSHSGLATYAALYWSTRAWALLKGVGFTLSMILYMVIEVILMRRQMGRPAVGGDSSLTK